MREATEAMLVVMDERATEAQIEQVVKRLVEMGMDVHRSTGVTRTVLGAVGQGHADKGLIEMLDGVHEVVRISEPYKLASRTFKPAGTVDGCGRPSRGREDLPRRRVQAAELAVQLPGTGRRRPEAAARCGQRRE